MSILPIRLRRWARRHRVRQRRDAAQVAARGAHSHVRVRIVMYGVMAGITAYLLLQGWQAERDADDRATETHIVTLAAGQRMHSQRVGRLVVTMAGQPGSRFELAEEMRRQLTRASEEAQALEALLQAHHGLLVDRHEALTQALQRWRATRGQLWASGRAVCDSIDTGEEARLQAEARIAGDVSDDALTAAQAMVDGLTALSQQHGRAAAEASSLRTGLALALFASFGFMAVEPTARRIKRQHQRLLEQAQELDQLATVARLTQNAVWITDASQRLVWANDAFARIAGRGLHLADESAEASAAALPGPWTSHAWAPDGASRYQLQCVRADGSPCWLDVDRQPVTDGQGRLAGTVFVATDITESKQAEETIHQLAFYDPLTDLPNRRLLLERLRHALATTARHQRHAAVLFIDLDNFKELNDTQGHDVGDLLLVEVARRLTRQVRAVDTVARHGGDEFVIILDELGPEPTTVAERALAIAEKLRQALNEPYMLRGVEFRTTPSIGICLVGGEPLTADEVLKRADTAMYEAKRDGRNAIRFYDERTFLAMQTRVALEADLRRALPERQFDLHFQRQVDQRGQVVGAELLLRWHHPVRGMVSPAEFIPVAEDSELIVSIGRWVLDRAARQIERWSRHPVLGRLRVAVNVSARQFRQRDFVEQVRDALEEVGADPGRLELELTEGLVLLDVEDAAAKMEQLKALGVRIAIDDFGTQYSSLSYLARLPLDQLKIDQLFVRGVTTSPRQAVIVRTIIGMARSLNLDVVAEGVETDAQRKFLSANGCDQYQGYFYGRPVPLAEFEASVLSPADTRAVGSV